MIKVISVYVFSIVAICSSHVPDTYCASSFNNGVCDLSCDVERHLFDGFDCAEQLGECEEPYPEYCAGR